MPPPPALPLPASPPGLARLNSEQRAVVEAQGNCLVLACPGSGKTATTATKAAFLLGQGQTVGAVTFSRDAALELLHRILALTDGHHRDRLLVGTFHSVLRLMAFPDASKRSFGSAILQNRTTPFKQAFQLASDAKQVLFASRAMQTVGISKLSAVDALRQIDRIKNHPGPSPIAFPDLDPSFFELVKAYNELLARDKLVDFTDMVSRIVEAMTQADPHQRLHPLQLDHLIIDEAQDTDPHQYGWIALHATHGSTVTAVGDDDQSVFGFRSAMGYQFTQRFAEQFFAEIYVLSTNYRSHAEILAPAATLIAHNTERIDKPLVSAKSHGGSVQCRAFPDSSEEADAVAEGALASLAQGRSFAVIVRYNWQLREIQRAMLTHEVPFQKTEGRSLLQSTEIQVYHTLLSCVVAPQSRHLDTVMAWMGVAESDIHRLATLFPERLAIGHTDDFVQAGVSDQARLVWQQLCKRCHEWKVLNDDGLYSLVNFGVFEYLKDKRPPTANEALIDIGLKVFEPKSGTLQAHLAKLLRLAQLDRSRPSSPATAASPAAIALTAHNSKGLEFDDVWIIGMEAGVFPSEKGGIEEERRLAFVAMTRARQNLVLSHTHSKPPSIFLAESGLLPITP